MLALGTALHPGGAAAAPRAIVLLRHDEAANGATGAIRGEREAALLDALRIYTRDLGCKVLEQPGAPSGPTPEALQRALSEGRRREAELVVWLSRESQSPSLFALRVADGLVHATPAGAEEPQVMARTLALKVRALYARPARERPAEWTQVKVAPEPPGSTEPAFAGSSQAPGASLSASSPQAGPSQPPAPRRTPGTGPAPSPRSPGAPSSSPPAAPAGELATTAPDGEAHGGAPPTPTPTAASRPPPPGPVTTVAKSAASARPRRVGIELGVGYTVDVPNESTWLRQGAMFRGGLVLTGIPRIPLALEIDAAYTSHASAKLASGGTVEVSEVPLGLMISGRFRRDRILLGGGPRGSLHFVDLKASGGPSANAPVARTGVLTAGLGALLFVRYEFTSWFAVGIALGGEFLLPHRVFTLGTPGGETAADLGLFQLGLSIGPVFRAF